MSPLRFPSLRPLSLPPPCRAVEVALVAQLAQKGGDEGDGLRSTIKSM